MRGIIGKFLSYSFIAFCAVVVTTPPISVVIVFHGHFLVKIVQWLLGFFYTGDINVTPFLFANVIPPSGKPVGL